MFEVCTDYTTHGHTDPSDEWRANTGGGKKKPVTEMTDDEREQARAQRRLVIGHNKAWAAALLTAPSRSSPEGLTEVDALIRFDRCCSMVGVGPRSSDWAPRVDCLAAVRCGR